MTNVQVRLIGGGKDGVFVECSPAMSSIRLPLPIHVPFSRGKRDSTPVYMEYDEFTIFRLYSGEWVGIKVSS